MRKKYSVFRGLAAITALLLTVCMSATTITFANAGFLNSNLGIQTTETIGSNTVEYTAYYENEYGYDEAALKEVYYDAADLNIEIAGEGIVLLKNENNALPLSAGSASVTIFGNAAVNSDLFKTQTPEYIEAVNFVSAMEGVFGASNVNTELCTNVYSTLETSGVDNVVEAELDAILAYEDTWQNGYNDAAIVVLGRHGAESNDLYQHSAADTYEDGSARRLLDLSTQEQAMMEYLVEQKEDGVFKSIIVIIASEYQMELGFIDDYGIDACIMAGMTGSYGCEALAKILSGEINPSGKTVDTYAANSLSSPANVYSGPEGTVIWANEDEILADGSIGSEAFLDAYIIYAEGIYVGYKYYETRYADTVYGQGDADSTVGTFASTDGWDYTEEMCYTFGYGLSYTTFDQTIDSVEYDEESDSFKMSVTVTNTGDTAGKDVVQIYAQTPYGDYEKENLVEKAAVQLIAYGKTSLLEPGSSETLTIDVKRYFLASYDTYGAGTYILSEGSYYLAIGTNSHDALNNILAAQGYTTADGMDYDGDASKVYDGYTVEALDAETYSTSVYTDTEVVNLFDDCDINYYDGYEYTYMSRQDWSGTWPEETDYSANEGMMQALSNYYYETPEDAPNVDEFTQEADNGLTLTEMIDVDFDDPLWDDFVDQLSVEEMANLWSSGESDQVVSDLEIPGNLRGDDDQSAAGGAIQWVSHPLSARTWNNDLALARGKYQGLICVLTGKDEIWYGAGNLHRTPFGGRAYQYWSEDAVIDYYNGLYECEAALEVGCVICVKHLTCNDQETQRMGLTTFIDEQPLREIYLRAFEGSLANGALSLMTSTGRLGTKMAKNYAPLLTSLLREEWGYEGHVTSDGYLNNVYYNNTIEALTAGQDYSCNDSSGINASRIIQTVKDGDGYVLEALHANAKRNLYVISRTFSMNGLGNGATTISFVPAWQMSLLVANFVLGILLVLFVILMLVFRAKANKETPVLTPAADGMGGGVS